MNVLNKLSKQSLKLNKKRTISTIIGIMLSVALICAVVTMAKTFGATMVHSEKMSSGDWHFKVTAQSKGVDYYKNKSNIKDVFTTENIGYADLKNNEKFSQNPNNKMFMTSMSKKSFDKMNIKLLKGHFPKNSNEILVVNSFLSKDGISYKMGDEISLNFNEKIPEVVANMREDENLDKKDKNKKIIRINDKYKLSESAKNKLDNKKYKIVGIVELTQNISPYSMLSGNTIITTSMPSKYSAFGTSIYMNLKNPKDYNTKAKSLFGKNYKDNEGIQSNSMLLKWETLDFSDGVMKVLYGIIGIILGIIIVSSVFVIRNSFAIATTEKMKQYGFLASVGATKKQIKKNVLYEASILAIIGIPLGIILGIVSDWIVVQVVNHILHGISGGKDSELIFAISGFGILVSVLLGAVTIYLSARASARRASKVSPIENLKGADSIKINPRKIKSPKWVNKVFGIGGVIAYKNLKRNKKKYRTTVISIVVSIVIFVTMASGMALLQTFESLFYNELGYNIDIRGQELQNKKLIDDILSFEPYKNYAISYEMSNPNKSDKEEQSGPMTFENNINEEDLFIVRDIDKINKDFRKNLSITTKDKKKAFSVTITAYNDEYFKSFAQKCNLDYEKVKNKAILSDIGYIEKNKKFLEKKITKYKSGDNIVGNVFGKSMKIQIGGIVPTDIKPIDGGGSLAMLGNVQVYVNQKYFNDLKWIPKSLLIDSKNPNGVEKKFKKLDIVKEKESIAANQWDTSKIAITNLKSIQEATNSMMLIFKIFVYGFITIITLIGLTNIFNTITSNVELRSREFATLKSIGMTKKEFNKMVNLETIFYSVKALIIGIVISLLINGAMNKFLTAKLEMAKPYIPVYPILICIVAVFALVYMIMKYSIAKIEKKNVIETIRRENI